jgi:multimeric flavodoxin WrbA
MNIMTILGSPRAKGNTAQVLGWVEEQLRADGHPVDHVHIVDFVVSGCRECLGCKSGLDELCRVEDDANGLFRRMMAADAIVFAAPVFCWGFPAQLKALIDRMFCMVDAPGGLSKAEGKRLALVVTSAGPEENNAEYMIRGFDNLVSYSSAEAAGVLFVPFCTIPSALDAATHERATQFARDLTATHDF